MRTSSAVAAAVLFCFAYAAPALAQTSSTEAAATALFDQGMQLMKEGKYSEACPKLARSQTIAPSGGTLFNLAECYEKNGQTASAWVTWKQLAGRAADAGKKDVEATATERAGKLEPKLAKLTVTVSGDENEGLEVKRDGETLDRAQWGVAAPIDPGSHKVEASAPGKQPFSVSVLVRPSDPAAQVRVPPLARDDTAKLGDDAHRGGQTPGEHQGFGAQRAIGVVAMGLGAVGIGVGAFFGVTAMGKNSDATKHCRTDTLCDADGVGLGKDARDAASISTIGFIAGAVLAAGGAVLFFTAPTGTSAPNEAPPAAARVRFGVTPTIGGMSLVGQGAW